MIQNKIAKFINFQMILVGQSTILKKNFLSIDENESMKLSWQKLITFQRELMLFSQNLGF